MIVEKFVPKPLFDLEAVEFTGGTDNGQEIMRWLISKGVTADWKAEDPGEWNRCGMREHIKITKGSAYMFAYIGDYLLFDEDGDIRPLRRGHFENQYARVAS